jgi:calcineurin-like phosphoesterase family protein
MSKKYIGADYHFGHTNILKFQAETRPGYANIDEMNEDIIRRHNAIVNDEDTTYIVGDVSFAKPEATMQFLRRMNGYKILIHGNHDERLLDSPQWKLDKGISGVVDDYIYHEFDHGSGKDQLKICLFHFPIEEWNKCHRGSIHFFGHQHGNGQVSKFRKKDVGIDTNELFPYNLDDLINEMKKRPFYTYGHHQ